VIRRAAKVAGVVVLVFGLSFVIGRWTASEQPVRSQVVVAPAPPEASLRVRTLRGAPKLPRLQRLPAATLSSPPPAPAPPSLSATPAAPPPAPSSSPSSLSVSPAPPPPAAALRAQVPWPTLRRG